ncbi:MAG TPA: asparagine synthetase B family protein [Anaerolineaceae bacterium]|nr:asparagine synthetase B family protein [Anaerolineaceae bacterium]HPN53468.1 asparagine synthetase B family protein [Anaerolineaceae bacterium]
MLLRWDRATPSPNLAAAAPNAVGCLWADGIFTNQAELCHRCGLPPSTPLTGMLAVLYRQKETAMAGEVLGTGSWIIWDGPRRRLLAFMDRTGERSLYYTWQGSTLWLDPNLETLLAALPARPPLNRRSLVYHLAASFPDSGETFYEGIQAVPPGCLLIVQPESQRQQTYWSAELRPLLRLKTTEAYAEAYRSLLLEVTAGYIRPGPLAVTLSSGLDCASVAVALKTLQPNLDLSAITYVTPGIPEADESELAAQSAARLGLPQIFLDVSQLWPLSSETPPAASLVSPFRNYYDEIWDTFYRTLAGRGIRTLYLGTAGDDLFGGNILPYADFLLSGRWKRLVEEMRYHLPRSPVKPSTWQAINIFLLTPIRRAYLPTFLRRPPAPMWMTPDAQAISRRLLADNPPDWRHLPARQQRRNALHGRLMHAILEQKNRHAASHGVELVSPLIDSRMVDFALSLPPEQTVFNGQRKTIVRNALKNDLPEGVINMWGKITPGALGDLGLRDKAAPRIRPLLQNMRCAELGLVDEAALRQRYEVYCQKGGISDFWYAVTLEDWLRRFF